ncbi:MAG: hypothetical protein Crog4KO_06790 [Crocinitomicaceae bacterium]
MKFNKIKKVVAEVKQDYPRLTWRLSIFSALASVAFYIGVLQKVLTPADSKDQKIEHLKQENERLKNHITLLEEKLK